MEAIRAFLLRMWNAVKEYWQNTERNDRIRFIAISVVALAGIIVAIVLLTRVEYVVAFENVATDEVKPVQDAIVAMGISTKLQGSNTILVPEDQVDQVRVNVASLDLLSTGYSFEFIERGAGFGTSEAEKKNWGRVQKEVNLQKMLLANPKILSAHVEIAQPDNGGALFVSEKVPVTASVALTLTDEGLAPESVEGITKMVAASYPDLLSENVSVIDQNMNLLNRLEPTGISETMSQHEMELTVQQDFQRAIMALLVPIFGQNGVRSQVTVDLDFDNESSERITVTPVTDENGIVVSMRRVAENAKGGNTAAGEPGINENGGDEPEYPEVSGDTGSTWSSTTEEINYEINTLKEMITKAKGSYSKLTASVVINATDLAEENAITADIQDLVGGVLGLSKTDYAECIKVSVKPMDGLAQEAAEREAYLKEVSRTQLFALIRVLALYLVLGLCIALLIHRVFKFFHKGPSQDELLEMQRAAEQEQLDEYADLVKLAATAEDIETTKSPERMKVEDFVDRSPDMVANLLRNWLADESPRGRR